MAVTIKRIAELAGVSTGTVDRALHDRGRVDPKVAQRVKQIAAELNYQPNSVAKSLSTRNRHLKIAVILHLNTPNSFFDDVIAGIARAREEIRDFGVSVDMYPCRDFDPECQLRLIDTAIADGANGIVIVPMNDDRIRRRLNELYDSSFPVAFLTNIMEDVQYLSYIGCNYRLSGQIAAGLLNMVSPGGGRLLLFCPSFQMYGHTLRAGGLRSQLEENYPRIRLQKTFQLSGDDIRDYALTREALAQYPETDLIVCPGAFSHGNLQAIVDSGCMSRAKTLCYDYSGRIDTMIRSGEIFAALTQCPQEQGYTAVKTIFNYLCMDKKPPFRNNYIRTRILLRENLSEIGRVRAEYNQD